MSSGTRGAGGTTTLVTDLDHAITPIDNHAYLTFSGTVLYCRYSWELWLCNIGIVEKREQMA